MRLSIGRLKKFWANIWLVNGIEGTMANKKPQIINEQKQKYYGKQNKIN